MNSSDLCGRLIGAVATEYRVDFVKKEITMRIQPAGSSPLEVLFRGIRMLGWAADDSEPQQQLELSVVGLEATEDQGWKVYFNPWYTAELEFECEHIIAGGEEVVHSGDCFEG